MERRMIPGVERFLHHGPRMRTRCLILLVALAAALSACKKSESELPPQATDTTSTSTMAATQTTGTNTGTGSTGGTASTLSDADKEFVMKAAQGGMAEVALGSLASQNGTSADVKT